PLRCGGDGRPRGCLTFAGRGFSVGGMGKVRCVEVEVPGEPEAMAVVERESPAVGAGQARVRVEAAGVNFIDIYQRSGVYAVPRPIRLGLEGAGIVEEVGPGGGLAAGQRVAWA